MSHEIRTPMNAILGFSQLLEIQIQEEVAQEYVQLIQSNGHTLLTLINDILDLSKIEAGQLSLDYEEVAIRPLLSEIQQSFAFQVEAKGIDLIVEISDQLPEIIEIDPVRLRQILFNLVSNAIKFTNQGQITIRVNAALSSTSPDFDKSSPDQPSPAKIDLEIQVSDTGRGISDADQAIIFEPFQQSKESSSYKPSGTGLGLTITRRLVDIMGGSIALDSQLQKGSTFTVRFPNLTAIQTLSSRLDSTDLETSLKAVLESKESLSILIVDDVESNRKLLQAYLDFPNCNLLSAANGYKAIELVQEHQPDLILLDLVMPDLDGQAVLQILKQDRNTQDIPVIIVTASVKKDSMSTWPILAQGFLQKPVLKQDLAREIERIFSNQTTEVQPPESQEIASCILPLSAEEKEKLSELIPLLEEAERHEWPTLCQTLEVSAIDEFILKLHQWAKEYQFSALQNYAKLLGHQLDQLDLVSLPVTLEEFPKIKHQLNSLLE
ncbi:ATP-binding protein [Roseofilum capinflatum]|uniref:histidine kinase n=1 Tax=Roseofilum capinflatum BLCC-M114 TaxID=3022440 RepID=A0ABT7B214_9CYAN|nr:ATP-binding protein [Roseofilum capinflatum]MDJ1173171.1 ATP-binding protein [Roseofilum capinflatum BLCC-M114]